MQLLCLSIYYQNDLLTGFGFTITNEQCDLDAVIETLQDSYSKMWAQAVKEGTEKELVADLTQQLNECARCKANLDLKDPLFWIAVGNVWLLVEMGVMENDEYNGYQLVYGL